MELGRWISDVAFPIAAYLLLFWYMLPKIDKLSDKIDKLDNSIVNDLAHAIEELAVAFKRQKR